jgi:hemin uptake protein HemP
VRAADETRRAAPERPAPRTLTTAELFAGRREIVIVHGDAEYRLRVTRANKLILTK